ncbi:poly [ADP-ribose] polymerase tankyrase-2 [Aplysia californica]|uniref:Poly [ADP-ribose] polymerase tankyrase-2 n=1 Tax=Aplysia californica TaxID=6500 RepID=A0ABM0JSY5_APLCA|nr:poly [ADP-ribose] polymerase tankyrase-2 [Aplysia californica]
MGQAGSKQEMFWEACGFGRAHLVQKFIEHGIDVNWVSSIHACSPIHVASQGKPDVVKLLIGASCDLTVQDSRGNTAVHHAAMKGHAEIIQMLADAGADLNAQEKNGWSPLHCAAYFAHLKAVEVLLKNKCDTGVLNKDGRSALVETARSKNHEDERVLGQITQKLIAAGCDVDLKCADLGEANFTALMFAAYHNHVEVADALIKGACDLNCVSLYTKWTALHWAADCGNEEMVYLLLDAGADPTCTGMRGETAADRAKDEELKEFLENSMKLFNEMEQVETASLSSAHSINAQASLDTAKALENLSTHAKNRDILSAPMPTIPALGIASRSDPTVRYTRRDVDEVAKTVNVVFPWRSYSKQASPSPDKDGLTGEGEERRKMFPSQDDKTNRFMDTLAQRINYMTSKIASMSVDEDADNEKKSSSEGTPTNDERAAGENSEDSGLSTRDGSRVASEVATPDNDGASKLNLDEPNLRPKSPKSPKSRDSAASAGSSKLSSPSKNGDMLDEKADACIIEESHRGFSILKALQERHRRSMCLDEAVVPSSPTAPSVVPLSSPGTTGEAAPAASPEIMSQV